MDCGSWVGWFCGGLACEESVPDRSGVEGDTASCGNCGLDSLEWNRARNLGIPVEWPMK